MIPSSPLQSPDEARDFHIEVFKVSDKIHLFGMHGTGLGNTGMKKEKKKRKKARAPISCLPGVRSQVEQLYCLRCVMSGLYQHCISKSCDATESPNRARDLEVGIPKHLSYTKSD